MKKLIVVTLCFTALSCKVQKEVIDTNLLSSQESFQVSDSSKDQLYLDVNTWFVEVFRSAESVIEFSDKEAGRIVGKYVFTHGESLVRSIIQVDVKDNQCKISFKSPLTMRPGHDIDYRNIRTNESLQLVNEKWKELAEGLEKYLLDQN